MSASRRGRGKVMPRRALVAPSGVSLNSPLAGTPGALRPAPFGRRCPPCRGRGEVDGGVRSSEHSALCARCVSYSTGTVCPVCVPAPPGVFLPCLSTGTGYSESLKERRERSGISLVYKYMYCNMKVVFTSRGLFLMIFLRRSGARRARPFPSRVAGHAQRSSRYGASREGG